MVYYIDGNKFYVQRRRGDFGLMSEDESTWYMLDDSYEKLMTRIRELVLSGRITKRELG